MVEHCPDWAVKLRVKAFEERTWFLDRRCNKEFTMEDSYCATSQIVAKWLELDQDYIYENITYTEKKPLTILIIPEDYKRSFRKIRFFGDEV